MKRVFIVNGYPRSGKDTFAEILGRYKGVYKYSSIDEVKKLALKFGWDGEKDERGRKLLADLKQALVEYDDLPLKYMQDIYNWFIESEYEILLLDIREPAEIEKAKTAFNAGTVLIENERITNVTTNSADASISLDGYDFTVKNNGTLEEFEKNIKKFLEEVGL